MRPRKRKDEIQKMTARVCNKIKRKRLAHNRSRCIKEGTESRAKWSEA
jgi:hypothetical protein